MAGWLKRGSPAISSRSTNAGIAGRLIVKTVGEAVALIAGLQSTQRLGRVTQDRP